MKSGLLARFLVVLLSVLPTTSMAGDIVNPDWLQTPNGADMSAAYPAIAMALSIEGQATIGCNVDRQGALRNCAALGESPPGLGFGPAAVAMSRSFRMRPLLINGEAAEGGTVRIPINFKLPPPEPLPAMADAAPENLEEAQRVVQQLELGPHLALAYGSVARSVQAGPNYDVDRTVLALGIQALDSAIGDAVQEHLNLTARAFATRLTLPQLRQWRTYLESAGRSTNSKTALILLDIQTSEAERIRREARSILCSRHACESSPPVYEGSVPWGNWSERATQDQYGRGYPFLAGIFRLGGWTQLSCHVSALGLLEGCAPMREEPSGLGIAASAIRLTPNFRLSPDAVNGLSPDRRVKITLGFAPDKVVAAAPEVAQATEKRLNLARRFVSTQDISGAFMAIADQWDGEILAGNLEGIDPATLTDARQALRGAFMNAIPEVTLIATARLANTLGDDELARAVAFVESPAGLASQRALRDLPFLDVQLGGPLSSKAQVSAGRAFCATYSCHVGWSYMLHEAPGTGGASKR